MAREGTLPSRVRAEILFENGAPVEERHILLEWDPYTFSILTEVTGTVHFKELTNGFTMQEQVDEITGVSQWGGDGLAR